MPTISDISESESSHHITAADAWTREKTAAGVVGEKGLDLGRIEAHDSVFLVLTEL